MLLANRLDAELFIVSTAVEKVALNFGKPDEQWVDHMSLDGAKKYLADGTHFAKGSMAPKIEAVIKFLERGGKKANDDDEMDVEEEQDEDEEMASESENEDASLMAADTVK